MRGRAQDAAQVHRVLPREVHIGHPELDHPLVRRQFARDSAQIRVEPGKGLGKQGSDDLVAVREVRVEGGGAEVGPAGDLTKRELIRAHL